MLESSEVVAFVAALTGCAKYPAPADARTVTIQPGFPIPHTLRCQSCLMYTKSSGEPARRHRQARSS